MLTYANGDIFRMSNIETIKPLGINNVGNKHDFKKNPDTMYQDFQVENIGVEPTTSCMPCKRSSQLS